MTVFLDANDDGLLAGEPLNFLIWDTLGAGTYYLVAGTSSDSSPRGPT